ncbi:MAG: MinD/ParA family protein [Thermoguttaceae bacterium]
MMHDQANDLRTLVRHATPTPRPDGRPRLIVVAGGKGGVGTTTLALRLAAALERRRWRTVLVDAARRGDAAILCHLEPRCGLTEVLAGRSTLAGAVHLAPGGLRIVPGAWAGDGPADAGPWAADRLLAQMAALSPIADLIVLDAGNDPTRLAQRCWHTAWRRLAVTTPETAAVMETYASIKRLSQPPAAGPVHLLVNMVSEPSVADAAYHRLAQACRRFLGIEVNLLGHVKKKEKGLNLTPVPADMKGELSAVDMLLNYADYVKFNSDQGTQLWHEVTPAFSAPWHS